MVRPRVIFCCIVIFLFTLKMWPSRPRPKKTVVFIGTSFTRAIFFECIKLVNHGNLEEEDKYIPSYTIPHAPGCNLPGKAGVDLGACGAPGFKVVENDDYRFIFHFKTYLYTPWADSVMLGRINTELGGQPADLMVLGSAEWGTNKYINNVTTRDAQVAHFHDDFLVKIDAKKRLFIYNNGYNRSTKAMWEFYRRLPNWSIYDMAPLLQEMVGISTGHGYYGYGTRKIFSHILKIL